MVLACSPICNHSRPLTKSLGIAPSTPFTTAITITIVFSSLLRSTYLSLFFIFSDFCVSFSKTDSRLCISSGCHAASTDLPDPLSPPVSIANRSRQHGSPWSSLATLLYRPSLPAARISLILFRHPSLSSIAPSSTDLDDPLLPHVSIVHYSREVFHATSYIGTELLYIGSSWSSNLCSSMWRGPPEYIAYKFVLTSSAVSRISGASNLDSFLDR